MIALIAARSEERIICGTLDLKTVIWGGGLWNNFLLLSSAEVVLASDMHEIFANSI